MMCSVTLQESAISGGKNVFLTERNSQDQTVRELTCGGWTGIDCFALQKH